MRANFISDEEIDRVLGKIGEFKSEPEWKTNFDKNPSEEKNPSPSIIPPQNKPRTQTTPHTFSYLLDDASKKNLKQDMSFGFNTVKAGALRKIYALGTDLSLVAVIIMGFIYGSILAFGSDSFIFAKLSFVERFYSYGIDEVVFWMAALYGILLFLYMFYFETTMGQTPGKMLLNIKIVDESNEKPSVATMTLRLFLFFILPFGLLGLHNRMTKTRIVLN